MRSDGHLKTSKHHRVNSVQLYQWKEEERQHTLVCHTKHVAGIEKASVGVHKIVSQQVTVPVLSEVDAFEANVAIEPEKPGHGTLSSHAC